MDKIFELIYNSFGVLENRDKEEVMREHLTKIPAQYHHRVHYIAQYGMQVWYIWVFTLQCIFKINLNQALSLV